MLDGALPIAYYSAIMASDAEATIALYAAVDFGATPRALDDFYGEADAFLGTVYALSELQEYSADEEGEVAFPSELVDDLINTHHNLIYGFQSAVRQVLRDREFETRQDKAQTIASLMVYVLSGYSYDPTEPGTGLGTSPPRNLSPEAHVRQQQNLYSHGIHSGLAFNALNDWSASVLLRGRYTPSPRANTIARHLNTFIVNKAEEDFGLELERDVKLSPLTKFEVAFLAGESVAVAGLAVSMLGSAVTRGSAGIAWRMLQRTRG